MSDSSLEWVVVSGAGGALGRAIVDTLANRGRPILALDRDCSSLHDMSKDVVPLDVDLTSEAATREAFDRLGRSERLGLVVNAVGLIWSEPILGAQLKPHALESWRRVIDANLTAAFLVATHAARRMVRSGGGSIINFSSISAQGNAGQPAYAAAKSGIEGLTRSMAAELGPLGVRVNAIAPGFIDVSSTREAIDEKLLARHVESTPVRRLGSVADVIAAVDYLDGNSFVNGAVMSLDGGLRL